MCNCLCLFFLQAPDWNEELQVARDLPQGTLEERLHRDRALLQVTITTVKKLKTLLSSFVHSLRFTFFR